MSHMMFLRYPLPPPLVIIPDELVRRTIVSDLLHMVRKNRSLSIMDGNGKV